MRIISFLLDKIPLFKHKKKIAPAAVKGEDYGGRAFEAGKRADKIFCEKRLFLDAGLTLEQLARESGTNRTYISKYISLQKGCGFKEYINRCRAEYAFEVIASGRYKTLADVAMLSGYGGVRAFKSSFEKRYNLKALDMIRKGRVQDQTKSS